MPPSSICGPSTKQMLRSRVEAQNLQLREQKAEIEKLRLSNNSKITEELTQQKSKNAGEYQSNTNSSCVPATMMPQMQMPQMQMQQMPQMQMQQMPQMQMQQRQMAPMMPQTTMVGHEFAQANQLQFGNPHNLGFVSIVPHQGLAVPAAAYFHYHHHINNCFPQSMSSCSFYAN